MSLQHYMINGELIAAIDPDEALVKFIKWPEFMDLELAIIDGKKIEITIDPITGKEYHLRLSKRRSR